MLGVLFTTGCLLPMLIPIFHRVYLDFVFICGCSCGCAYAFLEENDYSASVIFIGVIPGQSIDGYNGL